MAASITAQDDPLKDPPMRPKQIIGESIKWLQVVCPKNERWVTTMIVKSGMFAEMRGDARRYEDKQHTSRYPDFPRDDGRANRHLEETKE